MVLQVGEKPKFDFKPRTHVDIAIRGGLLNFLKASYVA